MDYVVIMTLTIDGPRWIVISYDIACQWGIHFAERCERYGTELDPFERGLEFTYLVPKFHLPAHILSCQVAFSFNYTPGVGRTEGEAPERTWSDSNGLAYSTREMGPGSRRDTLDDHFGAVNWAKVTKLGVSHLIFDLHGVLLTLLIADTFARRTKEGLQARQDLVDAFKIFDGSIPREQATTWTRMVQAWEADRSAPNPFLPSRNGTFWLCFSPAQPTDQMS
jgi:Kyakuja-Dileera-Zisupton transposase